jgi:hypothetical protein
MLIFTVKAVRLIDRAFAQHGHDAQRELWRAWHSHHLRVRRGPDDPVDDGAGPMPENVRAAVLEMLATMWAARLKELNKITSEDDRADLENDLAYIRSVKQSIESPPQVAQMAANR